MMSTTSSLIYKFASFRLDTAKRTLLCHGKPVKIAPKPLAILSLLVQRHGQIVQKEELIHSIWADAFVEEANISQNIFLLRRLLEKNDEGRQYLETIPKRGYRFVAKVRVEQHPSDEMEEDQRQHTAALVGRQPTQSSTRYAAVYSLAILPITNASADPNIEYFSDGITETLINNLSQLPYLRIIARTIVFRYKGREVFVKEIGHDLNVDGVVTGRALLRGDNLNLQVELINVVDESQSWGRQYNLKVSELFEVQAKMAEEISEQLMLKLANDEYKRIARHHTNNSEAYQLYLKGRYHQNKLTEEELKHALECFLKAIVIELDFALAYAGLADCYALGGAALDQDYDWSNLNSGGSESQAESGARVETMSKAKAAALRALKIDDTLAEAHVSMGFVKYCQDWDWAAAEKEYRRAIELRPNYAMAHYRLSMCLRTMGRLDEALTEAKMAREVDPLMLIINVELGRIFYFARYYDRAIEYYREALEFDSNFLPAHLHLGQAYVQKRMYEEAIEEYRRTLLLAGNNSQALAAMAHAMALSGRHDEARQVLEEVRETAGQRYVSAYDVAIIHVGFGEKEKALEWLERAYAERSACLIEIKAEPMLDNLRSEQRFIELMQRIGFDL